MKSIIKIYLRGRKKEWRWQMLDARNRRVIGASTESYKNRHAAVTNLKRVTGMLYVPKLRYGIRIFEITVERDPGNGIMLFRGRNWV